MRRLSPTEDAKSGIHRGASRRPIGAPAGHPPGRRSVMRILDPHPIRRSGVARAPARSAECGKIRIDSRFARAAGRRVRATPPLAPSGGRNPRSGYRLYPVRTLTMRRPCPGAAVPPIRSRPGCGPAMRCSGDASTRRRGGVAWRAASQPPAVADEQIAHWLSSVAGGVPAQSEPRRAVDGGGERDGGPEWIRRRGDPVD